MKGGWRHWAWISWRHRYDWRQCEAMLNDWGQYKTAIDGLDTDWTARRDCRGSPVPGFRRKQLHHRRRSARRRRHRSCVTTPASTNVAIVRGASNGIGAGIAKAMDAEGAAVIFASGGHK